MHPLIHHFAYDTLAPHLADAAKPFCDLAQLIAEAEMTNEAERTITLGLLKDARERFLKYLIQVTPASGEQLPYPERDSG